MPGLIEGHFHISFWGVRELPDLDLKLPAERTTVYAVKNAELALRCGYTGVASAGALHRIDVTIRDMVKEGVIAGPAHGRLGPRHLRHVGHARLEPVLLEARHGRARDLRRRRRRGAQGGAPEHQRGRGRHQALRHAARACCGRARRPRRRCTPTRRSPSPSRRRTSATARSRRTCAATTASSSASRPASTCSSTRRTPTTRPIAMIAERKDDIFVVPGPRLPLGHPRQRRRPAASRRSVMAATEYQEEWELGCVAMDKLRKAGVRVVPGGDYGFVWCPHGQYAKDIELFVTDMGFSPMEAIVAATKHGCRAPPAGARVRHDRGGQVRRHPRRRRRPARRHRDPAGPLEARHGDGERQGHGELARPPAGAARTSRTT